MNERALDLPLPIVRTEELAQRLPPRTPPWVTAGLLSVTGLAELNRTYERFCSSPARDENVFEQALRQLDVEVEVKQEDLARVPETGPVIVVSNHPFGGIDGLSLGATLMRRRSDVRIITNSILSRIAKLAPWFLNVDVFERSSRMAMNAKQVRAALRHLSGGGLLVVFPAGSVSRFRPERGGVVDDEWNLGVGMLARLSHATVVPCYFEGQNSLLFQATGLLHEKLSMILLPRELLARRESRVTLRVGRGVSPESLGRFADDRALTAWLRLRTYALSEPTSPVQPTRPLRSLAAPIDAKLISAELSRLPRNRQLLQQGAYHVYWARQADIPTTVEELGRLRELTFREIGEGTGQNRDLDRFDSSYHHLVLYDAENHCLVGAYRMAFCDERIAQCGLEGLYTHELFHYRAAMRGELTNAIELGRSFVRPEYQRKPLALALLWRGIGEVLCLHPRYRRLVGPVSISDRYRGSSRRMLLSFLKDLRSDRELAKLVLPRRPVRTKLDACERQILESGCRSVRELSRLVSELDARGQGVPVLLERYLELGARVLALSSDPAFSNCIDALVIVDLDDAPEALLKRFMGQQGFSALACAQRPRVSG